MVIIEQILKDLSPYLAPLAVALIATFVALHKMDRDHRDAVRREAAAFRRRYTEQQLNDMYSPLLAMLRINESLYRDYGPGARGVTDSDDADQAAGELWQYMLTNAILPNQKKIIELILSSKTSLATEDSIKNYEKLLAHCLWHRALSERPNLMLTRVPYPTSSIDHVESQIVRLRRELQSPGS